jgi:hypothetical protein
MGGPGSEGIGQRLVASGTRYLGQKALDLPKAIGPPATREQPQGIAWIPAQITGAPQSDRREKEQGQERLAACDELRVGQPTRGAGVGRKRLRER